MEKQEMIASIKRKIEEYGQCCRAKGCVETMAQTRKAMQKEDDFKYYEGQVKDREKNLAVLLDVIEKMLDIIANRKQTIDKLFKSIDVLSDYVRNMNNNTKGKKKRYYIEDQIIDFGKEAVLLFH